MKTKIALIAALALILMMLTPQPAHAKDLAGRFGLGADSTLGWTRVDRIDTGRRDVGNTGLSLVYYITDRIGLQLIASSVVTTETLEGIDPATGEPYGEGLAYQAGVGVRALIPVALTSEVNLTAVVGFSGVFAGSDARTDDPDDDPSPMFFSFDLGVRPEWFVTDHFSLHTQLGVAISLLNEDNVPAPDAVDASGVTADLFGNADLLGNAGFTFWF